MKAKSIHIVIVVVLCLASVLSSLDASARVETVAAVPATPPPIVVRGLVEDPLNLTYAQLASFPLLSETAELQCVGIGLGDPKQSVVYNWTGVPLFLLLSKARVISGANLVVLNAADGYSGSITLEEAMDPHTILALEANGTDLAQLTGFGSGWSRIVLPGRWGYKWVCWVDDIVVVDGRGSSYNPGLRPNCCTTPITSPSIRTMNVTKVLSEDQTEYPIQILSSSSIESFSFASDVLFTFDLSGTDAGGEFFYLTFPKDLLAPPYRVSSNIGPIDCVQTSGDQNIFLYVTCVSGDGPNTMMVRGSTTLEILQLVGPYASSSGAEYYNIRLTGHSVHLISKSL
jgi:DMSO/TMAO reductase YedYZ molybdopterin-dependent catalytic subunit